jgi:hypothetical protein
VIGAGYDSLNRRISLGGPTVADRIYGYDLLDRLRSAYLTGGGAGYEASWDALGRRVTEAGNQGTSTSTWDLAGRRVQLNYPGSSLFMTYDYLVTGEMTGVREMARPRAPAYWRASIMTISGGGCRWRAATARRPIMPMIRCRACRR